MSTREIVKQNDPLRHLLEAAETKVLIELIEALARRSWKIEKNYLKSF